MQFHGFIVLVLFAECGVCKDNSPTSNPNWTHTNQPILGIAIDRQVNSTEGDGVYTGMDLSLSHTHMHTCTHLINWTGCVPGTEVSMLQIGQSHRANPCLERAFVHPSIDIFFVVVFGTQLYLGDRRERERDE